MADPTCTVCMGTGWVIPPRQTQEGSEGVSDPKGSEQRHAGIDDARLCQCEIRDQTHAVFQRRHPDLVAAGFDVVRLADCPLVEVDGNAVRLRHQNLVLRACRDLRRAHLRAAMVLAARLEVGGGCPTIRRVTDRQLRDAYFGMSPSGEKVGPPQHCLYLAGVDILVIECFGADRRRTETPLLEVAAEADRHPRCRVWMLTASVFPDVAEMVQHWAQFELQQEDGRRCSSILDLAEDVEVQS